MRGCEGGGVGFIVVVGLWVVGGIVAVVFVVVLAVVIP